jgi:hypothetical protein
MAKLMEEGYYTFNPYQKTPQINPHYQFPAGSSPYHPHVEEQEEEFDLNQPGLL